ncbi:MAG: PAS domain S-box protein [Vitreimonas sp.]
MRDAHDLQLLLRSSEARAEAILKASLDAIVLMDHEGRFLDYNPAAEAMFGYRRDDVIGQPLADFIIPPRMRELHHQGMVHYLATGAGPVINHRVELPALHRNGEEFPVELTIVPIAGETTPVFVGFLRDISDRKRSEQRQAFLLDELSHRSKNLLAVIQAIINRTLKDHAPEDARRIIDQRITALARSHAALAANPTGASLSRIIADEIDAFSNRVRARGPQIHLQARAAQTMALLVHELATNAIKHGALASGPGRVDITWTLSDAAHPLFTLEWRECGGAPVAAPTRSGFGRTVLEQIAASEFKTTPTMSFASEGLRYRLEASLSLLVEESSA